MLLLLCCLALGSAAFSMTREVRDADDDDSEEYLPAEFRSSAMLDLSEGNSLAEATSYSARMIPAPLKALGKLVKIAKVAVLVLVATGVLSISNITDFSIPLDFENVATDVSNLATNIENVVGDVTNLATEIGNVVGDVTEFLNELPDNLPFGVRRESMAREAGLALRDLSTLLDEGAVIAVANLRGGAVGELSFAQARHDTANDHTIISGTLRGLAPGLHRLQVSLKGDLSDDCGNAGEAYSDESDGLFVANDEGKALVVVRVADAPLRGSDTVLGRSVVVTSQSEPDTKAACGIIVHPKR